MWSNTVACRCNSGNLGIRNTFTYLRAFARRHLLARRHSHAHIHMHAHVRIHTLSVGVIRSPENGVGRAGTRTEGVGMLVSG